MDRTRQLALAAAGVAAAFLLASVAYVMLAGRGGDFADCTTTSTVGTAAIGGPFELVDETGKTVTDADVITGPTLMYFGYTFCPDVCPTDAARNAEAVELLAERGYSVRPVFVSIDPKRDTPEVIAEWTDFLHPDMLGLTGTPEQVKAAAQAYRVYYKEQPADDGGEFYLVDHSVFTYLMMPEIGLATYFNRENTAEDIANTAACFIDAVE